MATDVEVLQSFLSKWPIGRLRAMTLGDYSGLGADDSYCWWLEHSAAQLGGIGGGSAFKFGVFQRRSKERVFSNPQYDEDGTYAWVRKYGDSAQSVFESIHSGLIATADASHQGNIAVIEKVDIPSAIKWKTAFLYQNQSLPIVLPIYAAQALKYLAFGDVDARRTISEAYQTLLTAKKEATDIFQFGRDEWARWTAFQGSVMGLIASDGNEWKDAVRSELEHSKRAVIWWSKRPSGLPLALSEEQPPSA